MKKQICIDGQNFDCEVFVVNPEDPILDENLYFKCPGRLGSWSGTIPIPTGAEQLFFDKFQEGPFDTNLGRIMLKSGPPTSSVATFIGIAEPKFKYKKRKA